MIQSLMRLGLAAMLCAAAATSIAATTPTSNPIRDINAEPGSLDFGVPAAMPSPRRPSAPARTANPLWEVPLSALTATRERPLFSPSRRPPAPAAVNAPVAPVPTPPPPPADLDLILVGTVAEASASRGVEGIAIFLDPATSATVRLRTGEGHQGWILQAVGTRAAVLLKDGGTETLRLPQPAIEAAPSSVLPPPTPGTQPTPGAQ